MKNEIPILKLHPLLEDHYLDSLGFFHALTQVTSFLVDWFSKTIFKDFFLFVFRCNICPLPHFGSFFTQES